MTSQILKFMNITKTQKSRYLKTFFLLIKKFINYTSRTTLWQKYFCSWGNLWLKDIPFGEWLISFCIEFALSSFSYFLNLIYLQIASNNHKKLLKTLSYTANKSVPRYMTYYSEGWHCIAILTILRNIQTFDCYVFTFWMAFCLTFERPVKMH